MTEEERNAGRLLVGRWIAPLRRFAGWFATTRAGVWANGKTSRWQTVLAVLAVAGIGFPLVINSIGATNAHVRNQDARSVEQQLYTTALVAYAGASNTYAICVASATAFAVDRERWTSLAGSLETAFGNSVGIGIVVDIIRKALGPDDPLTVADCPPPGAPPKPPQ